LQKKKKKKKQVTKYSALGVDLKMVGGMVVVSKVAPYTPGHALGFMADDVIVATGSGPSLVGAPLNSPLFVRAQPGLLTVAIVKKLIAKAPRPAVLIVDRKKKASSSSSGSGSGSSLKDSLDANGKPIVFEVGDKVVWKSSDSDIAANAVGTVFSVNGEKMGDVEVEYLFGQKTNELKAFIFDASSLKLHQRASEVAAAAAAADQEVGEQQDEQATNSIYGNFDDFNSGDDDEKQENNVIPKLTNKLSNNTSNNSDDDEDDDTDFDFERRKVAESKSQPDQSMITQNEEEGGGSGSSGLHKLKRAVNMLSGVGRFMKSPNKQQGDEDTMMQSKQNSVSTERDNINEGGGWLSSPSSASGGGGGGGGDKRKQSSSSPSSPLKVTNKHPSNSPIKVPVNKHNNDNNNDDGSDYNSDEEDPMQQQMSNQQEGGGGNHGISNILVLLNMVTDEMLDNDEEYDDILNDVRDECNEIGKVLEVFIPRPMDGDVSGVGKIFVEFQSENSALAAAGVMKGREFDGAVIACAFLSPEDWDAQNLDNHSEEL
jgi:hypothetical protein